MQRKHTEKQKNIIEITDDVMEIIVIIIIIITGHWERTAVYRDFTGNSNLDQRVTLLKHKKRDQTAFPTACLNNLPLYSLALQDLLLLHETDFNKIRGSCTQFVPLLGHKWACLEQLHQVGWGLAAQTGST